MACYQGLDDTVVREDSERQMADPATARVMRVAAAIEAEGYGHWNRVQEVIRFAREMGYGRLGLAFCIGLADEARVLQDHFTASGFKVYSVCCKLGALSKEEHGMDRLHPEWDRESTCNPIGQALELDRCKTELNIVVGLCVGHDIVFSQHATAPCTTLIVKDRVTGHNPAASLHTSYGRRRLGLEESNDA